MLKCDRQYIPRYFKIWFVIKEVVLKNKAHSGIGIKSSHLLCSEFQNALYELSEKCFSP